MGRVLSGIQPTGNLHLGNYLGAIQNWITLQQTHTCLFCVVDLHALTTKPNPAELRQHTLEAAAVYMAAGIDPKKSAIFAQSAVPAHSELMWILSCYTPLGWLNRMTQFKEKAGKNKDRSVLGLYSYPVLMAADILLYQATDVPVGEDQKQHLELTRDLAITFNQQHDADIFTVPTPLIMGTGTRVMSLKDGTKKMSKSDPAEQSRIGLFDSPEVIQNKIKKARTDMDPFPTEFKTITDRPEVVNLINIYAALANTSPQDLCDQFGGGNFAPFKTALADLCIDKLTPIREAYHHLMQDTAAVEHVLTEGAIEANKIAQATLKRVQSQIGLRAF